MYIFIISILVVSFIAFCFYKSKFWENRYLVLLISVSVALIATLTTNFIIRDKAQVKVKVSGAMVVQPFYLPDSALSGYELVNDSLFMNDDNIIISDSCKTRLSFVCRGYNNNTNKKISIIKMNGHTKTYDFDDIFIVQNKNDSSSYICNLNLYYDIKPNKLIINKLPKISSIKCLYISEEEYSSIPDSLIRELQF